MKDSFGGKIVKKIQNICKSHQIIKRMLWNEEIPKQQSLTVGVF